jgi:hypothetical protein
VSRAMTFFLIACAGLALLALPGFFWPAYAESPVALLAAVPYLSGLLLHWLGVPGLLVNNGACGWGWCPLTTFGWTLVALLWLGALYGLCVLVAHATRPSQ